MCEKQLLRKRLREDIGSIIHCRTVVERDRPVQHLLPNKVVLYLDVLGPCMKDRVLRNRYTNLIVRVDHRLLRLRKTKLPK